jgi:hypothetical protein
VGISKVRKDDGFASSKQEGGVFSPSFRLNTNALGVVAVGWFNICKI